MIGRSPPSSSAASCSQQHNKARSAQHAQHDQASQHLARSEVCQTSLAPPSQPSKTSFRPEFTFLFLRMHCRFLPPTLLPLFPIFAQCHRSPCPHSPYPHRNCPHSHCPHACSAGPTASCAASAARSAVDRNLPPGPLMRRCAWSCRDWCRNGCGQDQTEHGRGCKVRVKEDID